MVTTSVEVNWMPGYEPIRNEEATIPLDSELGAQITKRREDLDKLRETGAPYKEVIGELKSVDGKPEVVPVENKRNELDDYVPVYEINPRSPRQEKTIIGYRPMTEEEKSGSVNY